MPLAAQSFPIVTFLDCPIHAVTMNETIAFIDDAIRTRRTIQHGVVDAGKLALMYRDDDLFRAVVASDIVNGEGQLLVWLSRLKAVHLPERVVGVELFDHLLELAHKKAYRVYLLGAREEVVTRLVQIISKSYSSEIIAGFHNGYFTEQEAPMVAREIADCMPHMLFVGISSPKKEIFLHQYADVLAGIPFRMGVGGGFDVLAGVVKRAPRWMQKVCLEWFYRFLQEPRDKWKVEVLDSFDFLFLYILESLGLRRKANRNARPDH